MRIGTEHEAWEFLNNCWLDPAFGGERPLTFDVCALTIRLEPGDGRADWKSARAVNLLQHHLNLTYLLAKRGTIAGRISDFEREMLGIKFRVEPGSTNVIVEIEKALAAIYRVMPVHWSTRTKNIIIAGVMVATVALPFAKEYVAYRTEIDKAHIAAAATLLATERTNQTNLEIAKLHSETQIAVARVTTGTLLADATPEKPPSDRALILANLVHDDTSNVMAFAVSDYVPWRPALMALAPYAGTIQWNDSRPVRARAAKAIAKAARTEATKQRRVAKHEGTPGLITTPWVTEVLRTKQMPGAMRLGMSEA